jgi:hypothetical protein
MIGRIKKYVSDILKQKQSRYLGQLSIAELEIGNFFDGDTAVVYGIPRVTKKRDDGTEYDEPGVEVLRGNLSVVNGTFLVTTVMKIAGVCLVVTLPHRKNGRNFLKSTRK